MGWWLPPVARHPRAPLCMQTARGDMHLALKSSGDEAQLPSGVPYHTLPALFISYARSGQEPGCGAENKMDGPALIRGKERHKTTKKMQTPQRNCV